MSRTINVIIVDDSAFMRKSLALMLESDPQIKVIATARDGQEGVEKIKEMKPDLVTMDIEMPTMDGLTALSIIMKEFPVPVLMVSSLTTEGAKSTLDALALGAVDFIPKELSYVSLDIVKIKEELINKVKQIALSKSLQFRLQRIRNTAAGPGSPSSPPKSQLSLSGIAGKISRMNLSGVVVGISTGGPFALLQILPKLPASFPVGIAIVQHMPPRFTRSMAERLNGLCQVEVREAEEGDIMKPGLVLIAPGGQHMTFAKQGNNVEIRVSLEPLNTVFRPSADIMMSSAADVFRTPLLGLIMTGMGKDGLEGLKLIKRKGGYILAQNEETCVVYGMPKAAVDEGLADQILPLEKIPGVMSQIAGVA
jgi:two-component system, chemotaxis family, protein-glutamate methylesterase/glutaminase